MINRIKAEWIVMTPQQRLIETFELGIIMIFAYFIWQIV